MSKNLVCPTCGATLASSEALAQHAALHSAAPTVYPTPSCCGHNLKETVYPTPSCCRDNLKVLCPDRTINPGENINPVETVGPNVFSCPSCGRKFISQAQLAAHTSQAHVG